MTVTSNNKKAPRREPLLFMFIAWGLVPFGCVQTSASLLGRKALSPISHVAPTYAYAWYIHGQVYDTPKQLEVDRAWYRQAEQLAAIATALAFRLMGLVAPSPIGFTHFVSPLHIGLTPYYLKGGQVCAPRQLKAI